MTTFATELHRALASRPAAPNLVFSPTSIGVALAMVLAGARGETARQIDTVIGDTARVLPDAGDDDADVSIVNSLWGQAGYRFERRYIDTIADEFDASLRTVDYQHDAEAARAEINAWVDAATHQRIRSLLGAGALTEDTRLTLVNAIHMKAAWLHPFRGSATAAAAFTTASGEVVQTPTMHVVDHFGHATGDGWTSVMLPYTGRRLAMLVVLPDAGASLASAVDALADLAGSSAHPHVAKVDVSLPSFDTGTNASLNDVLILLGMPDAFDIALADFSGIAIGEPLFIGGVVHQANITVDEEGTEAAAATAVMMAGRGMPVPEEPIEFVVDRPFVFAVVDRPTGAVLFQGHIGDPTR